MINFTLLHPQMTQEHLGLIPLFVTEHDSRSVKDQIDANYQHGGGWRPIEGFVLTNPLSALEMQSSPFTMARHLKIKYPGDPVLLPLAVAQCRDETLIFYDGSFLAIFQPDYTFEIARLD